MRNILSFLFIACIATVSHAGQVEEVVGKSGVKAWLMSEHSLPLISVRLVFRDAGGTSDPAQKQSRAYLASQLLDQGAGERDALAFQKALDDYAIQFSTSTNDDALVVTMETLSAHHVQAFALLGDALVRPRFEKDALERVRAQVQTALRRGLDRPETLAGNALNKAMFGEHAYGRPSIGTKETVDAVTQADVKEFARRHLTKQNVYIAVVGDITPATLADVLDSTFAALPDTFDPDEKTAPVKMSEKASEILIEKDVPQTVVYFALPGIMRNDPDYITAFVMNHILGGNGLDSILSDEIREKRAMSYSVGTSLDPMLYGATLTGRFDTRGEQVLQAVRIMKETFARLYDKGVTQAQLDDAKQYLMGTFPLQLDSNGSIASFLTTMQMHDLGKDYLEIRNKKIAEVTLVQVNAMIKRILRLESLHVAMAGKPTVAEEKKP